MSDDARKVNAFGRREFLGGALSTAAIAATVGAGVELTSSEPAVAQSNLTPDEALRALMAGNERFAANKLTSIEHDLTMLRDRNVDKQEPFAAVLACADSRVPVELVFDQTIGQIFVARVAGNMVTPEIIASLETCLLAFKRREGNFPLLYLLPFGRSGEFAVRY